MADPLPNRKSAWETITVQNGQCEDLRCPFCAQVWFRWWAARERQMQVPRRKRGETTSFSEAAATSIRP